MASKNHLLFIYSQMNTGHNQQVNHIRDVFPWTGPCVCSAPPPLPTERLLI